MNLFDIYTNFIKEVFLFRSFKRMSTAKAVLSAIIVLPFILPFAFLMAIYGGILIFHKFLDSPTEYVYAFVKKEGTEVKHATQAVVYFVAFPIIFFLKVLTGILVFFLFIVHFAASIVGYFATLGGVTFSPFLMDQVDRFAPHETAPYTYKGVNVFITLGLILLALIIVFAPIANVINEFVYETAPERGFKKFCSEVQNNYKNDVITKSKYSEFYDRYESGEINETNYTRYLSTYKVNMTDYLESAENSYMTAKNAISFVSDLFELAYVLVVMIFTWALLRTKKLTAGEEALHPAEASELHS